MAWQDIRKKVKGRFSEFLEIPGDVMLDLPKITLVGDIRLFIENHRGIIEYTPEVIRVKVAEGMVEVTGENLVLRNILPDELCVEGKIRLLSFI